jgi:prophage maintenance system killer protein
MKTPPLRRLDMRGLIAIHQQLLARYGSKLNSEKSRDVDLAMLELSVLRAESVVRDPRWKARARLAAGYGWRVLVNRPFAVGNKRMALAAMVTCLEMNGLTWECGEVEETVMVQRAASKEMKEEEWEAWVLRNVGKKE